MSHLYTPVPPGFVKSQLLEVRKDTYVLLATDDKGERRVVIVPANKYTLLKFTDFKGERIMYQFASNARVEETFDDGIFNCYLNSIHLQYREGKKIADFIIRHKQAENPSIKEKVIEEYVQLISDTYASAHRLDLVKFFLGNMPESNRLTFDEEKMQIVIDDGMFMVDNHGNAYTGSITTFIPNRSTFAETSIDEKKCKTPIICTTCLQPIIADSKKLPPLKSRVTDSYYHQECLESKTYSFKPLCVVVKGNLNKVNVKTPVGDFEIDVTGKQVISKVLFLLDPNLADAVFTRQLPKETATKLESMQIAKESLESTEIELDEG